MYKSIGVIELKCVPKGVEAADAALKSAGIEMVSAHPSCPGKYEIILTGSISNVTAAIDHVRERFDGYVIDSSVMGRIDEQVISALFSTNEGKRSGSLGLIETYSASSAIKAADIAVKTARVEIYDLRVSRGEVIAKATDGLSVNYHAPFDGVVREALNKIIISKVDRDV